MMITAMSTNTIASRRLMRWNGDFTKRRMPAAVSKHFTASNASLCKVSSGGQPACWVAMKWLAAVARMKVHHCLVGTSSRMDTMIA